MPFSPIEIAVITNVLFAFGTAIHAQDQRKSIFWGVAPLFFGILGLVFYAISVASD